MAIYQNEETVDAPIVTAIDGPSLDFVLGQICVSKNLFKRKVFKRLIATVTR